jgi:Plavaka transposase
MQKIWLLMLDEAFVEAYTHGMLISCGDGVTRRIFPRIFTYAADYPEK